MLQFMTDAQRQQELQDAFEMSGAEIHPNAMEFYQKRLANLDAERMGYLISLVLGAKARYAARQTRT